jgi:hypothetical protein
MQISQPTCKSHNFAHHSLHGNHVVQRCLQHLTATQSQPIYDAVVAACVSVAVHKHGCCVLQRCVDYAAPQQRQRLVDEIVKHALTLVQNDFGNYVVQYVLDLGDANVIAGVCGRFTGKWRGVLW